MSRICQSCAMPMDNDAVYGTNRDGSKNADYCIYCYKKGVFKDDVTMEQYIEMMVPFAAQANMTPDEMRAFCNNVFPTLKRWKNK